uniref:NUCB1-like N-terminal domain-containing protein n=1 Tax=Ciona savignyi TaxID=51511 RepID=H2YER1_CIOSA
MLRRIFGWFVVLLSFVWCANSAPAPTKRTTTVANEAGGVPVPDANPVNTGLYYDQYLQKVIKLLESDESFKKKMENADLDDIKSGSLSNEIYKVSGGIREQLNALKKEEMNRLRKILHAKVDLDKGRKVQKSAYLKQIADHLDHSSPHTFEAEDLTKLIKTATSDLENYDRDRHEEFKKFEMRKEMQREEKLKKLDEQERIKAQEEYRKQQEEQAQKSKIHHPGSKAQLEDVWNEERRSAGTGV